MGMQGKRDLEGLVLIRKFWSLVSLQAFNDLCILSVIGKWQLVSSGEGAVSAAAGCVSVHERQFSSYSAKGLISIGGRNLRLPLHF